MPIPKLKEKYTYQDYCTWPDEERWEIIDGIAYDMSPAPTPKHQNVAGSFYFSLRSALQGKKCTPFISPIDVVLSEYDVVQPDVIVVCDPSKITEKNIQGAPDFILEVLSPSTSKKDRWTKKELFEKHGVREYILVEPVAQYVERFTLEKNNKFHSGDVFDAVQTMPLTSLEGIEIPLWEVFGIEKPPENE